MWKIDALKRMTYQSNLMLTDRNTRNDHQKTSLRIAIIGGGPRGVYTIERLASVWNSKNTGRSLEIVCFNKTHEFGSGPNFSPSQPDFLLMNNPIGQVDFWTNEEEQLVVDRPNLVEFIKKYKIEKNRSVQPADFCSRSLTGLYMQYCFAKVINAMPSHIKVNLIIDEVISMYQSEDVVKIKTKSGMCDVFDEVICCSGHSYTFDQEDQQDCDQNQVESAHRSINQIYPIENLIKRPLKGENVVVKGLGLTSIDVILGLTEGRGGSFYREMEVLKYKPSGNEPHSIYAFSRSGIPMLARQPILTDKVFSLRFFTQESVDYLCKNFKKLDFRKQVLPFIAHEFRYQYVMYLLHFFSNQHVPQDKTLCDLEQFAKIIFPRFKPFDLEEFLTPKINSSRAHQQAIKCFRMGVKPDNSKPLQASRIAMAALWGKIYPLCQQLYAFGKLTGKSQRYFDRHFYKRIQRTAFGPPKINVEKLLALAEVGILRFGKGEQCASFIMDSSDTADSKFEKVAPNLQSSISIDARIAKSAGLSTQPEYIRQLVSGHGASFFDNGGYAPGCLKLDEVGRITNQKRICMYGVPTEGWTLDNESLSRTNNNLLSNWVKTIHLKYTKHEIFSFDTHFTPMDRRA
ncbi:FAD/NAD(P)-binding protein [Belliella kenyensis]|uniref:FAD/NAD(P)-binding protein n=1 Tax=Belliella kenyensis TaxID=1472724 RepID=A0ABV8EFL2_9BACT|nr:FAD/NAD(P)-binding protein [Belliella kenyensis]MCH7401112.1 FAD/NAD(P)-binding protein [Belliella kenyensis]MDN3604109.1 FAD/NAD(P)-binding protein [Belliella kenyensis]